MIEILNEIDVPVNKNDFEACHRLYSKNEALPKHTIAKFVNCETCEMAFANRYKLKSLNGVKIGLGQTKIYINDNLYPYYKKTMEYVQKSPQKKNTSIVLLVHERNNQISSCPRRKVFKILHEQDLFIAFPGLDFESRM